MAAGLILKVRRRGQPVDRRLLPSRRERAAVSEPGARLVLNHVGDAPQAAQDVVDVVQVGIGAAHWGMRAVLELDPTEGLDNPEDPTSSTPQGDRP